VILAQHLLQQSPVKKHSPGRETHTVAYVLSGLAVVFGIRWHLGWFRLAASTVGLTVEARE